MSEFTDLLTSFHGLNRWLVLASASLAFGLSIAGLARHRLFGRLGRRTLAAFLAALGAQVGLGLLIVASSAATGLKPFDGSGSTLVAHALGGLLAISFSGVAVVLVRRRDTERAAARTAAIWTGLAALCVGKLAITLPAAVVVALFRSVTTQHVTTGSVIAPDDMAKVKSQIDQRAPRHPQSTR
jgi:hypothetical protein